MIRIARRIQAVFKPLLCALLLLVVVLQTQLPADDLSEWNGPSGRGERRSLNESATSQSQSQLPSHSLGTAVPVPLRPPLSTLRSENLALPEDLRDLLRFYEQFPAERPNRTSSCQSANDPLRLKLERDVNQDVRELLYRYFVFHREEMRAFRELRGADLRAPGTRRIRFVLGLTGDGLGNQMMNFISTLMVAIFTRRIIIFDPQDTNRWDGLFCELIPGSTVIAKGGHIDPMINVHGATWWEIFNEYVNANRTRTGNNRSIAWLDLNHDAPNINNLALNMYSEPDTFTALEEIPWLQIRTNQYYIPALFVHQRYGPWMNAMFPTRLVYPALINDILLPSDEVWAITQRTLDDLPGPFKTARRVALQLRAFNYGPQTETVSQCLERYPEIINVTEIMHATEQNPAPPVVVFVISLHRLFYEHLNQTLCNSPSVHLVQPSSDEDQRSMTNTQNIQALAEMWIIAASDVVVTTAVSTFGYHAAALAHRTPYVIEMRWPRSSTDMDNLACWKEDTYEPCFHAPHILNDTEAQRFKNHGLRPCKDTRMGITTAPIVAKDSTSN